MSRITGRDKRMMTLLKQAAIDVEPVSRVRIAAAITHKNQIISIGTNSWRTHPLQARFGKHEEAIYLHAEISAITKALNQMGRDDLLNSTLYIHRVKRNGRACTTWHSGLAKPCEGCMRAIQTFGFKRVVYSTDEDHYEVIRAAA